MNPVPYTFRRGARYQYRRRVHLTKIVSDPITLSLHTADVKVARERAATLSVRFETVRARMIPYAHATRDVLTAREVTDLFRAELEHELGLALAGYYDHEPDHGELKRGHRLFAEAYRMAQRPNREADVSFAERERLQGDGWGDRDIATMILLLRSCCHGSFIGDEQIKSRLRHFSIDAGPNIVRDARRHMLRARAAAQHRAGNFLDAAVQLAEDPVAALLESPATLPRCHAATLPRCRARRVRQPPADAAMHSTYLLYRSITS